MGFGYFMYSHSLVPVMYLLVRVVTKEEGKRELMGTMLKLNGRTEKERQKTRRSGAVVEPKKVRVEDGGSGRRS